MASGCERMSAEGCFRYFGSARLYRTARSRPAADGDGKRVARHPRQFVVPSHPAVRAWLAAHPLVHFHYTPPSASWLNQVEGFFGILGKQSVAAIRLESFGSAFNLFVTCQFRKLLIWSQF